ncbi:O-antigen ligase OS=Castellaniella defragrans OX=75697 GN=HNR28_002126 PE=4 SV=1 [Castellaniella defragrans]
MVITRAYPILGALTALGVFSFFAAMFVVYSGYSYGAAVLLVAATWYGTQRPRLELSSEDRLMMAVLLVYFAVSAGMTVWLGNNFKDLDQYVRALLVIPILYLLCGVPVRLSVVWAGIVTGIALSVPIAWWQVAVTDDTQAGGFMNKISFSNLTLVFVAFCAAGLFWAPSQGRRVNGWRLAFALGIVCGLYSTIVGGSRGSWVAATPLALLLLITFWSRSTARVISLWFVVAVVALAGLFAWPESPLRVRFQEGMSNITQIDEGDMANSIGARLEINKGAWVNLQRAPIWGWNAREYARALQAQVDSGQLGPIALHYTDNLHNNYLQAWVFTGLPGLLALLALYGVPLWHFGRRLRDADMTTRVLAFCGASLPVSFICFSLTYSALRRNYGIMFYVLALAVFWGAMRHARQEGLARQQQGG